MRILLAPKTSGSRKKVGFGTLPKRAKKPLPPPPPLTPAPGGWTGKFLLVVLVSLFPLCFFLLTYSTVQLYCIS